jgi:hypothetical protein
METCPRGEREQFARSTWLLPTRKSLLRVLWGELK